MDIILAVLGLIFAFVGIIGAFLPVLPGPITGWVGLLLLHLTDTVPMNWLFLGITLAVAILIWILDYMIPAMGTKKFGGSKYGVIGTTVGLIVGLFSPIPFGFLIGAFVGAFVGEMIYDRNDKKRATKAAFGSFLGFITSAFLKFIVASIFLGLYVMKLWEYREIFGL
ncbi:MAG: hypothetical protein COB98_01870 [Flavobacteriaceae bacterium]|nr:MAG: hypothetical protein COB98_01870 [Flavobacteriaceae bacterium]